MRIPQKEKETKNQEAFVHSYLAPPSSLSLSPHDDAFQILHVLSLLPVMMWSPS